MRYIVLPVGWLALAALGAGTMVAQERPAELTGCYDITARDLLTDDLVGSGFDSEIPRRIEFAGPFPASLSELLFGDTLRTEIVVPEGALPSVHRLMWGQIIGDSIEVDFGTGFGGVTATMGWAGDRWSGVARHRYDVNPRFIDAGPIEFTPVSCDSPPPVSIDAMLPIARSVELVGGLVITLGEPLPEALKTAPARGSTLTVTGARTTGLFAGADSVAVGGASQRRVTHIWMHYSDPSAYSNVKARLGRAYRVPREDEVGHAGFRNPLTSLLVDDLANGTGQIILMEVNPWGRTTTTLSAQERPRELTGCYDITAKDLLTDDLVGPGLEHEIPRRIEFAGPVRGWDASDTLRTEIVVPEGALPSVHRWMTGEIAGDSLNLLFSTGYGGVEATLGWTGDRWVGTARTLRDFGPPFKFDAGSIELAPVSCDSPPPVPVDAMLPITRSVELEGGLAITLGEPLPEALETTPARRNTVTVTGRTTGLFAGAESIEVVIGDRRVTHIWLYYADPDVHSSLESRFRDAYGVPEQMGGQTAAFLNRITSLSLTRLRNGEAHVDLWDRRW